MQFNKHSELEGEHAFLSASKYHWVNYSDEKFDQVFRNAQATKRGTELHEFAQNAIRLGIRLPRNKTSINAFVNDAIGFRMESEQVLYYSPFSFGTADAISFKKDVLRIHDLKTGKLKASMRQLEVYAALFCLEYQKKPENIEILLRIYQNDEVEEFSPDPEDITHIMDRIVHFNRRIQELIEEEE